MFLTVLNYKEVRVDVHEIYESVQAQDFIDDMYGDDYVEYLLSEKLVATAQSGDKVEF